MVWLILIMDEGERN